MCIFTVSPDMRGSMDQTFAGFSFVDDRAHNAMVANNAAVKQHKQQNANQRSK